MVYQCNGCGSVTYQPLGQIKVTGEKGKEKKSYSLPSAPCVDKQCIHCDGKHHVRKKLFKKRFVFSGNFQKSFSLI